MDAAAILQPVWDQLAALGADAEMCPAQYKAALFDDPVRTLVEQHARGRPTVCVCFEYGVEDGSRYGWDRVDIPCAYRDPNLHTIARDGDLLVGFRTVGRRANAFTVVVGGQAWRACVRPGEFCYALENRTVVPLGALMYESVQLRATDAGDTLEGVRLVYAVLDSPHRRLLACHPAVAPACSEGCAAGCARLMTVYGTLSREVPSVLAPDATALPDLAVDSQRRVSRMRQAQQAARVQVYAGELAAAAWHPRRFRAWCLPHDDEFALQSPTSESRVVRDDGRIPPPRIPTPLEAREGRALR